MLASVSVDAATVAAAPASGASLFVAGASGDDAADEKLNEIFVWFKYSPSNWFDSFEWLLV